jgi:hypothetical protein
MFLALFYALLPEPLGAKNVEFFRRFGSFCQLDLQSTSLATAQSESFSSFVLLTIIVERFFLARLTFRS